MSAGLPEGSFVDIGDGLKMHLHDIGTGPAVLFLHVSGPGASGYSNFIETAKVWAQHGYRCLLLDSLGYGLSSKPTDRGYGLDVMAGCALRVLDALGLERVHLVGNSQGGAQAIWIALEHPERVGKLIAMAPGGLETRETYMGLKGIRSMMRCIYGEEGITLAGMHIVFGKQVWDKSLVSEQLVEARYQVALTQPRHVFETMRVPDQSERLVELQMPVLALWGMDDVFCPPSGAHKIATSVPDARVVLYTRCGHWVMVEHRREFDAACLDFLDHD